MKKPHVLYNPKAGKSESFEKSLLKLKALLSDRETEYREVTQIKDYKEFFASISPEDDAYVVGGDGTLNHFVNDVRDVSYANDIYYFASGTGNDFLNDVAKGSGELQHIP